jgi:hypothetical protein
MPGKDKFSPPKKNNSALFSSFNSKQTLNANTSSVFSDFYLVEHDGQYILQLGLRKSFSTVDNLGGELPAYEKALSPIKMILEQLKLIPAKSNYVIFGYSATHPVIQNEKNSFVLRCDATPGNHITIKLEQAFTKQLITRLKEMGLSQRDDKYPVVVTVASHTAIAETRTAPTPGRLGR